MDDITSPDAQAQLDALTQDMTGIPSPSTNNEANNEPEVSQEQTLTTQPEPEAPQEEAQESTTPVPVTEEVTAPPAEPEQEEEEEYFNAFSPTYGEVPPLDLSQIPQDEEGNLDPAALAYHMQQRDQAILAQAQNMVQQAEEQRQEEKLWNKTFEAHPEIRNDRAFAEDINALRFGDFANQINAGKEDARMMTPLQAYKNLEKRFAGRQAEAVRQATESVKVQESVYSEPAGNAQVSSADTERQHFQNLRSQDRNVAEAAADALLSKRLFGE